MSETPPRYGPGRRPPKGPLGPSKTDEFYQEQKQSHQPHPNLAPNETEFALYQWTGQSAVDAFFEIGMKPPFKGVTAQSVMMPPNELSVSRSPHSTGVVFQAYPHGVSLADARNLAGGVFSFGVIALLLPLTAMVIEILVSTIHQLSNTGQGLLLVLFSGFGFTFLTLLSWFNLRFDLIGYRYEPTIFDRNAQQVHVFFDKTKLFSVWPLWGGGGYLLESFDWRCVRGHIEYKQVISGSVPQDLAVLSCIVTKTPDDPTVVAQFPIGPPVSALAVQLLLNRWEYLRRYMQLEAPMFAKDDGPFETPASQGFWGCLWWGQPLIGPGSEEYKNPLTLRMILAQLITLFFLPITMSIGILKWVTSRIKSEPKLSPEIIASIGGAPLYGADLEAWRNVIPKKGKKVDGPDSITVENAKLAD